MPESKERKKFFVVWSPQSGAPVVRYSSFRAAQTSAVRHCRNFPDQDVFILVSCWGRIASTAIDAESPASNPPNPDPEAQS
jgi:hypothetical protein